MHIANVLALVIVEASVLRAVWCGKGLALSLQDWQVPNLVIFKDLRLLVVNQMLAQVQYCVTRLHWELDFELALVVVAFKRRAARNRRVRLQATGRVR